MKNEEPKNRVHTLLPPTSLIHIITPPATGWLIAFHCPLCGVTTFLLSPWATKPHDGDYWQLRMCVSEEEGGRVAMSHNLVLQEYQPWLVTPVHFGPYYTTLRTLFTTQEK